MGDHLLVTLHLHEDGQGSARYHGMALGAPEWPPSPARVFQALIAGSAVGTALAEDLSSALEWLETLPPPVIAAPRVRHTKPYALFVPNNDADAVADPREVSGIRTKKAMHPVIVEANAPLLYDWSFEGESSKADRVIEAAERLYQLGRGTDMAWASAEVVSAEVLEARLQAHGGVVHRPEPGSHERLLACPVPGSLDSLLRRHRAPKLTREGTGRTARLLFTNPPKARFLNVSYERSRDLLIYELRARDDEAKAWPWALNRVVALVEGLRDGAADRLRKGLPANHDAIDRVLVGRQPEGSTPTPPERRVRIVPLLSIGHQHADRAIRRVLLDIPSGADLHGADVAWAFSGLEPTSSRSGAASSFVLIPSEDHDMLRHYSALARRFRSVTPVALPELDARRRIDPARRRAESKQAKERMLEDDRAVAAVHTALRHAGVRATAVAVHVQREPFDATGSRVEPFSEGTRFAKERLWHVEIELDRSVRGPLVLGDGRFLGLGVMAPLIEKFVSASDAHTASVRRHPVSTDRSGFLAFLVERRPGQGSLALARAFRRAVMARVQAQVGRAPLDRFFTGHEPDGGKAEAPQANHLAFQWDPSGGRFLIVPPHWLERRDPFWDERRSLDLLQRAVEDLTILRTSRDGSLRLSAQLVGSGDPLMSPSRRWLSVTPYAVTRHAKCSTASDAIAQDVIFDCQRRGLPRPIVTVTSTRGVAGRGLEGRVQLEFAVAVSGPIMLGRTRYLGGGLFAPAL